MVCRYSAKFYSGYVCQSISGWDQYLQHPIWVVLIQSVKQVNWRQWLTERKFLLPSCWAGTVFSFLWTKAETLILLLHHWFSWSLGFWTWTRAILLAFQGFQLSNCTSWDFLASIIMWSIPYNTSLDQSIFLSIYSSIHPSIYLVGSASLEKANTNFGIKKWSASVTNT